MHKTLVFLKGFADGKDFDMLQLAITKASLLHKGQKRKLGEDYIEHPMRVANKLKMLKLQDENLLAAALLHDVLEDCEVTESELRECFNEEIVKIVKLLSKDKVIPTELYYTYILSNPFATLIKIADRCHNVSTMVEAFTKTKIKEYIEETNNYVIPLCREAVNLYPQYNDEIYLMKDHIESVCYALTVCIDALESKEV